MRPAGRTPSPAAARRSPRTSSPIARRSARGRCRRRSRRSRSATAASISAGSTGAEVTWSGVDTGGLLVRLEGARRGEEPGDGGGRVDPLLGPLGERGPAGGGDLVDLARRSAGAGLGALGDQTLPPQPSHQRVDGAVADAREAVLLQ